MGDTQTHTVGDLYATTIHGSGVGLTGIDLSTAVIPLDPSAILVTDTFGKIDVASSLSSSRGGTGADLSATTGGLALAVTVTDGVCGFGPQFVQYGATPGTAPLRDSISGEIHGTFVCDAVGDPTQVNREYAQFRWDAGTSKFCIDTRATGLGTQRQLCIDAPYTSFTGRAGCSLAASAPEDYVRKAEFDALAEGITWQPAVKSITNNPSVPYADGDRYIAYVTSVAPPWTKYNIYQWSNSAGTWIEQVPEVGWACFVKEGSIYPDHTLLFSDTNEWTPIGISIDHLDLINRGTNTHAQIDSHIAAVTTDPHAGQDLRIIASPTFAGLTLLSGAPTLLFSSNAPNVGSTALTLDSDGILTYSRPTPGTFGDTGINAAAGYVASSAYLSAPLLAIPAREGGIRVGAISNSYVATHPLEIYSKSDLIERFVRIGKPDYEASFEIDACTGEFKVIAGQGMSISTRLGVGMPSETVVGLAVSMLDGEQLRLYNCATKCYSSFTVNDGGELRVFAVGSTVRIAADDVLVIENATQATSPSSAALITYGGIGAQNSIHCFGGNYSWVAPNVLPVIPNSVYQGGGIANGHIQYNIQNTSTGASASSDYVVTCTAGSDASRYLDLGVNGSGYSSAAWTINGANDGYLYMNTYSLAIGTDTPGTSLKLFTGGTLAANARMTFTDGSASTAYVTIPMTTSSSSATTGALVVTGGLGIGGNSHFAGVLRITNRTSSSNATSGALVVAGGIGCGGSYNYFAGHIRLLATTAATNVSSGVLTCAGGMGISGALFVGGSINAVASTASTSTTTGALIVTGGVGIGGALFVGGNINAVASTASASATTGALVVTGGVGIGGAMFIDNSITASSYAVNPTARFISLAPNHALSYGSEVMRFGVANTERNYGSIMFGYIDVGSADNWVGIRVGTGTQTLQVTQASLRVNPATASTSTITGALIVTGGAGIGGALYVGGQMNATAATASTSVSTGALVVAGGIGVTGNSYLGGVLRFTNTTASTTFSDGAVVLSGGMGIGGILNVGIVGSAPGYRMSVMAPTLAVMSAWEAIRIGVNTTGTNFGSIRFGYVGNNHAENWIGFSVGGVSQAIQVSQSQLRVWPSTDIGDIATVSFRTNGGAYITKRCQIADTTQSTSTVTGALIVAGGVGIVKDVYVGGTIRANQVLWTPVVTSPLVSWSGFSVFFPNIYINFRNMGTFMMVHAEDWPGAAPIGAVPQGYLTCSHTIPVAERSVARVLFMVNIEYNGAPAIATLEIESAAYGVIRLWPYPSRVDFPALSQIKMLAFCVTYPINL